MRQDNLSTYFQKRVLEGSDGYHMAPIYESPNIVPALELTGETVDFPTFVEIVSGGVDGPLAGADQDLGENRFTHLVGQVGVGKTFLYSLLAQHLTLSPFDPLGVQVLPVYVDLEAFHVSHDQHDEPLSAIEFQRRLVAYISAALRSTVESRAPKLRTMLPTTEPDQDASVDAIATALRSLFREFRLACDPPTRFLLILDNLDALYYPESRYVFFPEDYDAHRDDLRDRLRKLLGMFLGNSLFEKCGLCITIAARNNLALETEMVLDADRPTAVEQESHKIFQLGRLDAADIVNSRLTLLGTALTQYVSERPDAFRDSSPYEQFAALKLRMGESIATTNVDAGLRRISDLAPHGARSVVRFIRRLELNLLRSQDVIDRLFGHSSWLLERLYIADGHYRY